MARTRTAGIQADTDGCKVVDKRVFGVRIKRRIGKIDQDQAEAWLAKKLRNCGKPSYSDSVLKELSAKLQSDT